MSDDQLAIWTIYKGHPNYQHPDDLYVAVKALATNPPSYGGEIYTAKTITDIRRKLPPGLFRINRDPKDDPTIVEVWL